MSDQTYGGMYRAVVMDNADPESHLRLLLRIPDVLGDQNAWAVPSNTAGGTPIPDVGQEVWVMFEAGNADYPIWMGQAG